MSKSIDSLRSALQAGHPLIAVVSPEEDRVRRLIDLIARENVDPSGVYSWTCTQGLEGQRSGSDTLDPVKALQAVSGSPHPGYFLFFDLAEYFDDRVVIRAIRDCYNSLVKEKNKTLFLVSPKPLLPEVIEKNVHRIYLDLPDPAEHLQLVEQVFSKKARSRLGEKFLSDLAYSLTGLTQDEAQFVLQKTLSQKINTIDQLLEEVQASKKMITDQISALQFIGERPDLDLVGGLDYLKDWINRRRNVFNQRSVDQGIPIPKGILIMGISGCGKSLCAKVVARMWGVPLFRLDMNLVFSDVYGNPEATFHKALRTVEAAAPVVLWIDEIENGLGFSEAPNAIQSHIFSAFLTWMQEKPPMVFVAATANRIECLPAELIRKGRFDQVFFCDLPDRAERKEMFKIHIQRNHADPDAFDIEGLCRETVHWNAAEIEQAVNAAHVEASSEGKSFTTDDIIRQCKHIVPLSHTMAEQIQLIRDWAWDRATPASKGRGTELNLED